MIKLIVLFAALLSSSVSFANTVYSLGLTSDYVTRGISQTNNLPALQAGVEETNALPNLLLGLWSSNASPDKGQTEVDLYFKYTAQLNADFSLSYSALYFYYTKSADQNTGDSQLAFENPYVNLLLSYRQDSFGTHTHNLFYEIYKRQMIDAKKNISVALNVGYSTFGDNIKAGSNNYVYRRLSLIKGIDANSELTFFYTSTNREVVTAMSSTAAKDQNFGVAVSKMFE